MLFYTFHSPLLGTLVFILGYVTEQYKLSSPYYYLFILLHHIIFYFILYCIVFYHMNCISAFGE